MTTDDQSGPAGPELAEVTRYADGTSKCYYCGSMEHDDAPCPERANDAERYAASGRSKYPTSRPHNSLLSGESAAISPAPTD